MDKTEKKVVPSAYGIFRVSTETDGDSKQLGVYEGYIDEIAMALAPRQCYGLTFDVIDPRNLPKRDYKHNFADIHVYGPGFPKVSAEKEELLPFYTELFKGRPVVVSPSNYCSSVVIEDSTDPDELKRRVAMDKLTDEDKRVLGLI